MRINWASRTIWYAAFLLFGIWCAFSFCIRQSGSVLFRGAPAGAKMYLDGTFIGVIPDDGQFRFSSLPLTPLTFTIGLNDEIIFKRIILPEDQILQEILVRAGKNRTENIGNKPSAPSRNSPSASPAPEIVQSPPVANNIASPPEQNIPSKPIPTTSPPVSSIPENNPPVPLLSGPSPPPLGLIFLLSFLLSSLFVLFLIWIRKRTQLPPETSAQSEISPDEYGSQESSEPDVAPASTSSPESGTISFLEDLKHREALINHGFTTIETGQSDSDPVVDLDDFHVGEDT